MGAKSGGIDSAEPAGSPVSKRRMFHSGTSESRFAKAAPAEPEPTTMKSKIGSRIILDYNRTRNFGWVFIGFLKGMPN